MNWITARRRHPLARYAVLLLAMGLIGLAYTLVTPTGNRADATIGAKAADDVKAGEKLYQASCMSCHGVQGAGGTVGGDQQAPSLVGVGAAAVDFQVSTGRMPAAGPGVQMPRKSPRFNEEQTRQLAAYVATLGGGPAIPTDEQVKPDKSKMALGGELFRANCIQCHNYVGSGGALTKGKFAPPLDQSTDRQIYEAMITGPQAMPVFNDTTVTPEEKRAIIAYILEMQKMPNPGGSGLGRVGPVSEGLVAFIPGIVLLVLAAMWLTAKQRRAND